MAYAYRDPLAGYIEGMQGLGATFDTLTEQRRRNAQDARAQQEFDIKIAKEKRQAQDEEEMRGLAATLAKGKETTLTAPNPLRKTYDLQKAGGEILADSLPSRAESMDQVPAAAFLNKDTANALPPSTAVSPLEGAIPAPEPTLSATVTTPYTPQEAQSKMVAEYLKRGLLAEASKYVDVTSKMDADATKHATFVGDLYAKTGYNWEMTKALLKMNAPQLGLTPEQVDKLDDVVGMGSNGMRFARVPDPTSVAGYRDVLVDAKGKPVNMKALETTADTEAAKQPYRDQKFAETLKVLGIKEEQANRMFERKAQLAKELKLTNNMNLASPEDELIAAQMLIDNELAPAQIPKRSASYFRAVVQAKRLDPNYNPRQADANYNLAKNPAFRSRAITAEQLPEVLTNMVEAGKKVNFSDVRFVGVAEKWIKGQLNDPDLVAYMALRNDSLMEIAQVMRQNGVTDQATMLENEAAHPTMSPTALEAWMKAQMSALQPRLKLLRGVVTPPKSTSAVDQIEKFRSTLQPGESKPYTLPDGSTMTVYRPTGKEGGGKSAAPAWKPPQGAVPQYSGSKQMGWKTPDGKKYYMDGRPAGGA